MIAFRKALPMLLIVSCAFADGKDDLKLKMIHAIQVRPKCDADGVAAVGKEYVPDDEVILEAAKEGCLLSVLPIVIKAQPETPAGTLAYAEIVGRAERNWLSYVDKELVPAAEGSVEEGGSPWSGDTSYDLGNTVGVFQELSGKACKAQKIPELRASDTCKFTKDLDRVKNRLMAINKKYERSLVEATAEHDFQEACDIHWSVKTGERLIARQKAGAQYSGVVDAKEMYESGQQVSQGKERLSALEGKYKKATGRAIDYSKCRPDQQ